MRKDGTSLLYESSSLSPPLSLYLPFHLISTPNNTDTISQIAALTGGGQPEFAGNLYTYLVAQPNYATSEARQALVRRLREALVKSVSIVGVCRPLEAVFSIDAVERAEDKDYSCTRYATNFFPLSFFYLASAPVADAYFLNASENWQSGPENHARGAAWLDKVYQRNRTATMNSLAAHKDFCTNPL